MSAFGIISLADSIQPLKEYFDDNKNRLRFLAVLSPM